MNMQPRLGGKVQIDSVQVTGKCIYEIPPFDMIWSLVPRCRTISIKLPKKFILLMKASFLKTVPHTLGERHRVASVFFHLLNFEKKIMIVHVTNKVINQRWRNCNNLFKTLIKTNIKYMQSNQFFNYFTNNNNEINGSPKIRVKAKGTTYKNEI